jgi:hypothetical protein
MSVSITVRMGWSRSLILSVLSSLVWGSMVAPGWALAIAGRVAGTVGTGSDSGLLPITRFEGSFSLDANTGDYDPQPTVGRYALGSYDFSFFRGDTLVGTLASTGVVPRTNSLAVFDRSGADRFDELMLFVQQSGTPQPGTGLLLQSLSLGFQLPSTVLTSDRLPLSFDSAQIAGSLTKAVVGTLGLGRSGTQPLSIQSAQLALGTTTAIPTPALLPGLLGLGLGVLRQRRRSQSQL